MTRVLFVPILSALLFCSVGAAEPVYFPDTNLKAAVEAELQLSDPTSADMLEIISLSVGARQIGSLTGLEYATNLQALSLFDNGNLSDISPLSVLTNLETLALNQNQIGDLSPLSGLANLQSLDVHHNLISDVSPLSGLLNLRRLALRENPLSDISSLAGLSNLQHLSLLDTQVSDISALSGLTSLEFLDLRNCPLNQDAYDVYLPQILALNAGISLLYDPLLGRRLSISSTAGGSVTQPGEGEFLYADGDFVRVEAQAEPGSVFAGFTGSCWSTQNPTFITMDQDYQMRANFLSLLNVLHVDDDAARDPAPGSPESGDPHENGTPEHPFDRIQEAIEVAAKGTTILVHPGTYRENIDLLGKDIRLMGIDSNDLMIAPYPVIEGAGTGPVVRFGEGEGPGCVLAGFVITRGRGRPAGAIHCEDASPTISNCLIVGNRSTDAEAAAVCCVNSQAVLTNCTIADNYGGEQGAALVLIDSSVTVRNSILWGNSPTEILATGTSNPSIRYCDVRVWWLDQGNFSSDPLFAQPGHWASPSDPNLVLNPRDSQAVWITGDYHLKSQAGRWDPQSRTWTRSNVTSPCIDRGDPGRPVADEPFPNGGVINIGAYGGTAQASKSHLQTASP